MFSTAQHRAAWLAFARCNHKEEYKIDVAIRLAIFPEPRQRERLYMDCARDLRATRRWFAEREAGWSPAERVRRSPFYADELWAYPRELAIERALQRRLLPAPWLLNASFRT